MPWFGLYIGYGFYEHGRGLEMSALSSIYAILMHLCIILSSVNAQGHGSHVHLRHPKDVTMELVEDLVVVGKLSASNQWQVSDKKSATGAKGSSIIINTCQVVRNPILIPGSAEYLLSPIGAVELRLHPDGRELVGAAVVKTVVYPKHGLIEVIGRGNSINYRYKPKHGYYGIDNVEVAVSVNGRDYLVRYVVAVSYTIPNDDRCPAVILPA